MADLVNEFSWSISQGNDFVKCKRMFYYGRYGSWEGWPSGKGDSTAKALYMLKKLTTKEMWAGSVVHDVIRAVLEGLRNGYTIDYTSAEQRLTKQMVDDFQHSKQRLYQKNPKNYTGFFEHEYGLSLTDVDISYYIDHAIKCLQNFFNSEIFKELQGLRKDQWLTIDELKPLSFILEGTRIWAKIDLAVKDVNRIKIFDWKTGKKDDADYSLQLSCYLSYALNQWGRQVSDIEIFEVNLATGKVNAYTGSAEKLKSFESYALDSINTIKEFVQLPSNTAKEEDFEQRNDIRFCKRCEYLKVCKPPVLPDGLIDIS